MVDPVDVVQGMIHVCQLVQVLSCDERTMWLLPVYPKDKKSTSKEPVFALEFSECPGKYFEGQVLFIRNLHITRVDDSNEIPTSVGLSLQRVWNHNYHDSVMIVHCIIRNLLLHESHSNAYTSSISEISRLTALILSPSVYPPVTLLHVIQHDSIYSGFYIFSAYINGLGDPQRDDQQENKRLRGDGDPRLCKVHLSDGVNSIEAFLDDRTLFLCSRLNLTKMKLISAAALEEYTFMVSVYCTDIAGKICIIEAVSDVNVRAQSVIMKTTLSASLHR